MVPSGAVTRSTIADLAEVLEPGDLVIDGGNSRLGQRRQRRHVGDFGTRIVSDDLVASRTQTFAHVAT